MGMNRDVYSYLLKTYGRQPGYWVGIVLLIIQTLSMRVVLLIIVAHMATDIAAGNLDAAKQLVLVYLGVAVIALLCRFARDMIAIPAEHAAYAKIVDKFYGKLVSKDVSFFRDHQTGYLSGLFRQHIDSAMDMARLIKGEMIQTAISMTIPVTVLIIASWKVGLAALAVIIVQVMYVFWSSSTAYAYRAKAHESSRRLSGAVSDNVTNIIAYKTSGRGKASARQINQLAQDEIDAYWLRRKKLALMDAPRELITLSGTALAFWVIINSTHDTATTVGLVVLTISYMVQIFNAVTTLPDIITKHDDFIAKLHPTLEYLTNKHEKIADPPKPLKLTAVDGRIDIEDVSFSYPGNEGKNVPVFDGLNLHIPGGQQVGVVGLSGAGKSTLASLLMRFDDVGGGSIKIDGTDIRDVRQEDLRSQIAYVPQEPLLFHRSIRENLEYFGKDVTEKRMIQASEAAHAHEFITRLPDGYDSMVGERGVKLSGGQKQRVVIARAILKDAPIMLFDEATSALDSESEKIIQRALPEILGRRTAIVIAHRLSTIAGLDRIIVMENGRIIEDGTHAELLKQKGRYYSLWQKQINHDKEESTELPPTLEREGILQNA